jgi:hypothetical protein
MNAFENNPYYLDSQLDSNPESYATIIVGDRNEVIKDLKNGSRLSISVNMENFNIYIGADHMSMQFKHDIPMNQTCAGHARIDRKTHQIIIEDATDWRKRDEGDITANDSVKQAIAARLQKDLFGIEK